MLKTNGYVTKTDGYVTGTSGYVWVRQTYPDVPGRTGDFWRRARPSGNGRVRPGTSGYVTGTSRVRHLFFKAILFLKVFFRGRFERKDRWTDRWMGSLTNGRRWQGWCLGMYLFPTQL